MPSVIGLKLGEVVELRIRSLDTNHGFRIREAGVNVIVPKRGRGDARILFRAQKKGVFPFECSKACGAGPHDHARPDCRQMRRPRQLSALVGAALLLALTPALAQDAPSGSRLRTLTPRARVSATAESRKGISEGRPSQPGNPLIGITVEEFELFRIGLDDFLEVEDAGEGLGPAFNGLGCAQCHATPAVGGISPVAEVRAGHVDENGNFTVLGGSTLFHLFFAS